jgi:hypothetical protein
MKKEKASISSRKNKKNPSSSLSPLLRSAFEVLEHGLWHYLRSNTTADMKFALLHIDQAIELFLKEKVRSSGVSIYKGPKETITIWGAYQILENDIGCKIKEKPNLELLHEERNNIQHKYSNPSPDDAAFHVGNAMKFIKRFVSSELKLNIYNFLPREQLEQVL